MIHGTVLKFLCRSCLENSVIKLHFTIYVSDETLGTALHRLSEKQRSAILLRYFQGMNDREISELYHVSRSAIFSRISRGLKKLKTLLSERK